MCNYKLTVTISKNSEIVDGGGWVTSMTWRKSTLLEAKDRAQVLALRDLLNGDKPRSTRTATSCGTAATDCATRNAGSGSSPARTAPASTRSCAVPAWPGPKRACLTSTCQPSPST